MSQYEVKLTWKRTTSDFNYDSADRTHEIQFPGGQRIKGSSAPEYRGKAEHANPEELLLSALSSCHMLTFIAIAAKSHLTLDSYEDEAVCYLEKGETGILYVTRAVLRPKVTFAGEAPTEDKIRLMHEKSHKNCFIANSVNTKIAVEPIFLVQKNHRIRHCEGAKRPVAILDQCVDCNDGSAMPTSSPRQIRSS